MMEFKASPGTFETFLSNFPIVSRSLVFRSSGGAGSGSGAGGGGGSKPATRQIRTRARIMRSNTAIRGGSNSGK